LVRFGQKENMLGLILIYFVGRKFFELAHEHNRSTWGFAILGVLSYYITQFIFGIIIAIVMISTGNNLTTGGRLLINVAAILIGVAAVWGLYKGLESYWGKNPKQAKSSGKDLIDNF
jgi:predicted permease